MALTAKITSKGQVTIPRKIRDVLKSNTIEFELVSGGVVMRPVSSVGGALHSYAKGHKAMQEVRDKVWEEVAHAKERG
ncbi:MAG: AbrB/MazE/SpoVT family DNA-binding domain-containing protein [Deltaproteobacteria bacterium]|nr:AbrB/MazE/SpoVT family DNA-binding domain-containing protein [Deltaproteobacteria bacterium]